MECHGPHRCRLTLTPVVMLTVCLVLLMAWALWDQNRLLTTRQDEITRLQEYIRRLEERLGILNHIRSHRPTLPQEAATALASAVQQEARRYDLDCRLLLAIIRVESEFNPRARSPRGAIGLMQVTPAAFEDVASELGWVDWTPAELEDLRVNVRVGTHYLFSLLRRFGNLDTALQGYYLGPSRIRNEPQKWERLGRRYLEAVRLSQSAVRMAPACRRQERSRHA